MRKEVTAKERVALNTLITEKRNQIEDLKLSITESKLKIKAYRDNRKRLDSDIKKLKRMFRNEEIEQKKDIETLTREYEEKKEKERLHLLNANVTEILIM